MYQKFWKRGLDLVLSGIGIVVLAPVWLILAVAIKVDDPGPVFFRQKRIAQDKNGEKRLFQIYKYRSMKMCTPHDMPTHLLENPEQYITKVGAFLRKTSLDELPQIFNIFLGQMSVIGPRPALWNQDDLYEERAKYGANGVKPGLTGWAQINGRDELEIDVKAKLDGEYVEKMGFAFDCKCFFGTITSVLRHEGVVEGGTGEMKKQEAGGKVKKILITGANSYIGMSFEKYMAQWPERYQVDTVDMIDGSWREKSFAGYDCVYHVAGIAHSDSGKISPEKAKLYYAVNTDLTVETARKAKADGVRQFIFMSSAIVYGESAPIGKRKVITRDTPVSPANSYGDSKVQAENGILPLNDNSFKVVILRPPMIYGKGSKGNYPVLSKLAQKLPVFPKVENQRSMLYIDNLMEFVRLMVENGEQGIFWPQNAEYSNTTELVQMIAQAHGKKIAVIPGFTWALKLLSHCTGLVNKAFGSLSYERGMSQHSQSYWIVGLEESVRRTEE